MRCLFRAFNGALLGTLLLTTWTIAAEVTEYRDANVFDGSEFVSRSICVEGSLFVSCDDRVTKIEDLESRYVIPPFADTHTHHFDSPDMVEKMVPKYLSEGVFYARNLTNKISVGDDPRLQARINIPDSVDVAYAHAGLTGTNGHPIYIYEAIELGIMNNWQTMRRHASELNASRLAEGDAYFIIESKSDLQDKWPAILESHPDILKVYLVNSAEHLEDLSEQYVFGWRGINPDLLPEIVTRAHSSDLPVIAHVLTRADFRAAIEAGVDELAHIPGSGRLPAIALESLRLLEEDAALAAAYGVIVTPTAHLSEYQRQDREALQNVLKFNLELLKRVGVKIAIGADAWGQSSLAEAKFLHSLAIYTNAELLKAWSEEGPSAIFPTRKIGRITPGYDASFLVLEKNPLVDFEAVESITMRVKQGRTIRSAD